jgi:hypothetical protein
VQTFVSEFNEMSATLSGAVKGETLSMVAPMAQLLEESAKTIGASALARQCGLIATVDQTWSREAISAHLGRISAEFERVCAELRERTGVEV